MNLRTDLIEDARGVGDEKGVEGRLEEARFDAVDALACLRIGDVDLVWAVSHHWTVFCVQVMDPVGVVSRDDLECRGQRREPGVPWPWNIRQRIRDTSVYVLCSC